MPATRCIRLLAGHLGLLAAMAGLVGPAPRAADRTAQAQAQPGALWQAVSDRKLDRLRGGFDLGSGLVVSFGITRTLLINGELVTQSTLSFDGFTKFTPAQAEQMSRQVSAMGIVQNGPGNIYQPGPGGSGFAIVIQNTLDNQQILNQTVINASSNAGGMIKNLNLQSTLNDSLMRAVGPR
jgi:hypothetical protein